MGQGPADIALAGGGAPPDDAVAEVVAAEYAVQHLPQVAVGGVVAEQEKGSGGFQGAPDFQQADGHIAEIGAHAAAADMAGGVNEFVEAGVAGFQFQHPILVDVGFPGPDVEVAAAGCAVFGPDQAGGGGGGGVGNGPVLEQAGFIVPFLAGQGGAQAVGGKGFVFGKGRVDADQVDALAVQRAQEVEVVGDIDAAIDGVKVGHNLPCGCRMGDAAALV